ncbi:MAG: chromate transporter [Sedimentisphaerales bacterium]|nr:chromate transporter [Sedimentisphaerales bacterium]
MNSSKHDDPSASGRGKRVSYVSLFFTFFRLGLMTFGGGFAMAAVLRHEIVLKRRWLTERDFIDTLSIATSIPGAIAVNLAFLEGRRLRGLPGGFTAAAGTMCPSVLTILLIVRFVAPYFDHPVIAAFLKGCAVAVAGQIAFAALSFARRLRRNWQNITVCGTGLIILGMGLHPFWAVATTTLLGYLIMRKRMMPYDSTEAEEIK